MDRRTFLRSAAALAPLRASVASSDKIVIGIVGAGGRGAQLTDFFCRRLDVEVAWICDVNTRRFDVVGPLVERMKGKRPKTTGDFRHVLDDKSVDAIVNATPEHWHAVSTIMACQAGKDVYLEKAVSHNIWEGRKTVEAVRKHNRVVQVGMQSRSAPYGNSAIEAIRAEKFGKIHLVRVYNMLGERRKLIMGPDEPAPEGLNWDMWLGPAASRPYNPGYLRRLHWDLDGGSLTGDTVHQLDLARWVLGVGFPRSVQHTGGKHVFSGDDSEHPDTRIVTFDYGQLTLTVEHTEWTPYMRKIAQEVRDGKELPEWYPFIGTKVELYGTDGMMVLGRVGGGWQIYGPGGEKGPWDKYPHTQMQLDHVADFVDCVRTRRSPRASIEDGHISAALCHMASASYRCGNRKLSFDPKTETFGDDPVANRYLRRQYRAPWVIPEQV
jgi:predicted dehydrogenase